VVLRMDLRDFFPSIRFARVQAFFRTAGYPDMVASALAGICTNAVPSSVWHPYRLGVEQGFQLRQLYGRRHLPQGAPTSPSLANLCAYRLDCRLHGLAASTGAAYTRYADDLAFSGDESFSRHVESFAAHVSAILLDEGFVPHTRKRRIMRLSVPQQLAGMVVNQHLNIARPEYDRLKAILTNCVRLGWVSQNREGHPDFRAHLAGRIAFVATVHAAKGVKLRSLFNQIAW
jgi:RNA-directed DNA polymerase